MYECFLFVGFRVLQVMQLSHPSKLRYKTLFTLFFFPLGRKHRGTVV